VLQRRFGSFSCLCRDGYIRHQALLVQSIRVFKRMGAGGGQQFIKLYKPLGAIRGVLWPLFLCHATTRNNLSTTLSMIMTAVSLATSDQNISLLPLFFFFFFSILGRKALG